MTNPWSYAYTLGEASFGYFWGWDYWAMGGYAEQGEE